MKKLSPIGISSVTYSLPNKKISVEDVVSGGMSTSSNEILRSFGFSSVFISEKEELYQLFLRSAQSVLNTSGRLISPDDIAAVILYTGVPTELSLDANHNLGIFEYVLPRLINDLGLSDCRSYALSQQGCSGLISAIELAENILQASPQKFVLCISGDRFPSSHKREIIYNLVSDAAGALLLEKDPQSHTILSISQRSNMALWDTSRMEQQILATYFPMATRAIQTALEEAHLTTEQITWFIPHNVSIRSWEMLAQLVPFSLEKVWLHNVSRIGHTVSCDHIINLSDMEDAGLIKKGDLLFFFTFGFGAHWSSMIVRR